MEKVLYVGIGGFFGAIARYGIGFACQSWFTPIFPWATLFVNVTGSLALGWASGQFATQSIPFLFFGVGVLGAYTTFSSFSLDTYLLIDQGKGLIAALNVFSNFMLCFLGVWAGRILAQ